MPANPNKDVQEARRNIDTLLTKGLKSAGKMAYIDVVRETLLNFPVTRGMVESFIHDFYIEPGTVSLKDGFLFPGDKQ